ncbi:MAG TPA: tyrosine-type recombinase/integrase [Steroidobacteraceae bacterium]|nr:tyrosine-type recombinase/integrase [Steroidobacteraceae bacterium]
MAAIDQRGKNSWRARVRLPGFGLKTRTFDTKDQAEVWAERIERELRGGHDTIPNISAEPTLDEALERYEREITPDKKGCVQERRRITAWRRRDLAKLKLSRLTSQHFVTFRNERINAGTKRGTVRLDLALISHLYTIARKDWGMPYLTNPIADVRQPKADKWRDRRLSAEELQRFEQAIDTCYNRLIPINIRVALETAARKGELLALTWHDVDLERRVMVLRDTKNGDDRRVPLSQTAVSLFEQLPRHESGRVFPTTSDAITAAWRRICNRAGIKNFRYHDLRHEATTRLFERGLEIMEVQRITGHKTLSQLLRYTQMNVARIVNRLDETESPSAPASPRAPRTTRQDRPAPSSEPKRPKSHSPCDVGITARPSPDSVRSRRAPDAPSETDRDTSRSPNVIAFPGRR